MSLECHDTWCHLLTSFLVEKDVKMLWKCHDILIELRRIFMRKRHLRKMPWECHEIPMPHNGIENFGSFWWYFYEKVRGNVMDLDVIFDQNSDGNQWWHFIMRVTLNFPESLLHKYLKFPLFLRLPFTTRWHPWCWSPQVSLVTPLVRSFAVTLTGHSHRSKH